MRDPCAFRNERFCNRNLLWIITPQETDQKVRINGAHISR